MLFNLKTGHIKEQQKNICPKSLNVKQNNKTRHDELKRFNNLSGIYGVCMVT